MRLARPRLYEVAALLDAVLVFLLVQDLGQTRLKLTATLASLGPFMLIVLGSVAACAGIRAACLAVRSGGLRARLYLRRLTRPAWLADLARFLAAFAAVSYGYSWLKVFLLRLHPVLFDALLARADALLHFGLDPNRLASGLFPYPAFWRALDVEYALFSPSLIAILGWIGSGLSRRDRARFASGFAFLWLAGSWWYLATPSLGPCFVFKEEFASVLPHMPLQAMTQRALLRQYVAVTGGGSAALNAAYGVAAMPSLHVGAQAFAALWARRRYPFLAIGLWLLTFLTFVGSLVSGWHYAVDGYAGLLLAWLAYRWARSGIGVEGRA